MHPLLAKSLLVLLAGACLVGWLLLVVAQHRHVVPTWLFYVAAVLLIGMLIGIGRLLEVRSRPGDDGVRFADHRVVRSLTLTSEGENEQVLTLELVRELVPGARVIRLRFVGVARLGLQQLGDWPLSHDGLRIESARRARRDGMRYRVRDRHGEVLSFLCREVHEEKE
ncbi:MAG: hypothetical protein H6835_15885 [Planctomycetes bacterium]|nr:hypothetical protein [Planctomycetota bacterium]